MPIIFDRTFFNVIGKIMYIGIDLGTSGVKVVLLDEAQNILAITQQPLSISRPQPLWSEQDPQQWWQATNQAMLALAQQQDLSSVKAIGLTGQMHGAVALDKKGEVLYPAILWNDGRSRDECIELTKKVEQAVDITGNLIMPGFTAPKIKWLQKHQADIAKQIDKVLLPKDYLRFLMTGEFASDVSDAAGTMWLNVALRQWDTRMLEACGLDLTNMPKLFEGNQITGYLHSTLAKQWGMTEVPIVAGGGDNAAGAVGVGLHQAGQSMLSLGTSGVYFVVTDKFVANPTQAVHSFCYALPERWHLMSVILSAASCIDWANQVLGINDLSAFFTMAEKAHTDTEVFLPYLSGERTPHNNPYATGVFSGLTHNTSQAKLAKAVLEGVSFALNQGIEVLHQTGIQSENIILLGGGTKSTYWRQLLADISGKTMEYRQGGEVGPALGAAKLAQMALHPQQSIADFCPLAPLVDCYYPDSNIQQQYVEKYDKFKRLYKNLF